jgi:hypothetical protein
VCPQPYHPLIGAWGRRCGLAGAVVNFCFIPFLFGGA